MIFWENLTNTESARYIDLSRLVGKYVAWCALKKKEREVTSKPYEPSDQEFLEFELLAMKGWKMVQ